MNTLPVLVQELAREGNAMGVKLSELPQINAALAAATAWAKSAASASAPPSLRATHAKRPALSLVRNIKMAMIAYFATSRAVEDKIPSLSHRGIVNVQTYQTCLSTWAPGLSFL